MENKNKQPTERKFRFEVYQSDKNNNWYWRLKAKNYEIIASGEGYVNKADCLHAIDLLLQVHESYKIVEL